MKAEVAHFTTEQMVDMVGLLSPCMDDYLYVCDFKEDYYQISPNAVKRFCLPADHFHNVVEMHRQVVYPDDLDLQNICAVSQKARKRITICTIAGWGRIMKRSGSTAGAEY